MNSFNSKNKTDQSEALMGLEKYYALLEEDMKDEVASTLNVINTETDDKIT